MLTYKIGEICIQISAKCLYKINYWLIFVTYKNQILIINKIKINILIQKLVKDTSILKINIIRSKYKIKI